MLLEHGNIHRLTDVVHQLSCSSFVGKGEDGEPQPLTTLFAGLLEAFADMWVWVHLLTVDPLYLDDNYTNWRQLVLDFYCWHEFRCPPCIHYLTNHMVEDYLRFGPLGSLICEGYEAAHARDNRRKGPTTRGRLSTNDRWNTWAIMCRNLMAEVSLVNSGILERCVRPMTKNR